MSDWVLIHFIAANLPDYAGKFAALYIKISIS